MNQKDKRYEAIRELILNNRINNQTELLERLELKGFKSTQSTLSRDIKQMKLAKTPDKNGDYFYQLPELNIYAKEVINANITSSIEFSDTLAVIKTNPGYAMGIASDIDRFVTKEIMGTIAGDDTILIILRKNSSKNKIINALSRIIPSIREIKK